MTTYTLRYSKAGIMQYADIIVENNSVIGIKFSCQYIRKEEWPDFSKAKTLDKVMKILSKFSYDKKCKIWKIDRRPAKFSNNSLEYLNEIIKELYTKFYNISLKPLLPENTQLYHNYFCINKIPIQEIDKYEDDYLLINYLCYQFLYKLGLVKHYDFSPEVKVVKDFISSVLMHIKE